MDDNLDCDKKGDGQEVEAAAVTALADFKNPYKTGSKAVSTTAATVGFVNVTDDGSDVTVVTCFAEVDDGTAGATPACDAADTSSTTSNTIAIE